MSWFKCDDTAHDHPKIKALSDRAFRWWFIGLSYASRYLTDGVLPKVFWRDVPKQVRAELSDGRLWDWIDPHFQIHDYLHHQARKEDVEADKERNRQNSKAYRERRKAERRQSHNTDANPNVSADASADRQPTVSDPENREHIQITENREQRGEKTPARPVPLIARNENLNWAKKHGYHVSGFCDWVCLDEQQAAEFAAKVPGDDLALKLKQVREWALDIRRQWSDRIVPDGSHFDFWRNRWTETHGGSRPANATLKAVRAASDLDEAFR